ncbi:hypothetical protein JW698_03240 [Candidatus Wolfebacteria bacterium]|nr:hypothetical protein [Candidatus Wolfebacteria bacterium]
MKPREGNLKWYNPLACIRPIYGGAVNAVGLTNPGIDQWCKEIAPKIDFRKYYLVGSILGEPEELKEMAIMLNDFNLRALEINASCPNDEGDILTNTKRVIESCESAKVNSRHPIILKLSVVHDVKTIIKEVKGIVEALSINSVPWDVIFPNRKSPLAKLGGGGVSGKIVQSFTWRLVRQITDITDIPVIGPSVWDFGDMERIRMMGAKAVSFGSVFLKYPWRPTLFVKKEKN